jgi:hypothetical protein
MTESNEPLFNTTFTFSLPESQYAALLRNGRNTNRPIEEIAKAAIADYLSRTAPALEKVLSVD